MNNGRIYFVGALYHVYGSFSHLQHFMRRIADELNPLPYERNAVLTAVDELIKQYELVESKIDDAVALRLLMAEDLKKVRQALISDEIAQQIENETPTEENLIKCRDKGITILSNLGLTVNAPEIFIVDELPPPYNGAGYAVLTTDEGDYQDHGITPGLHFLKDRLRPFYSQFLLLHEMLHSILGSRSPLLFGRGLEEGLAEIVGSIYLSSKVLGRELTKNIFIYNRLSYGHNQFWEIYLDYTRQAAHLYHRFGLEGLLALINGGREKIKEVEDKCLRDQLTSIELPSGGWDSEVTDLINFLTMSFGRNLVVSPLAKYLSPYVERAKTVVEIVTQAGVELEAGRKALEELQNRIVVAVLREDRAVISLSDTLLLSPGAIIRYEIPE